MRKRADARYRTCSEFIEALEKACTGAKNWKPMPRGGSLNAPTLAEAPAVTMPAARRPVRSGGTTTVERSHKRRSGFLPFLAAILMAAALLALIGWQAGPWQNPIRPKPRTTMRRSSPKPPFSRLPAVPSSARPVSDSKPSPLGAPPPDSKLADDAAGKSAPPEDIPKPITQTASPETSTEAAAGTAVARAGSPATQRAAPGGPQPVQLVTSPGGATATLDGRSDEACTTPCQLSAAAGRHMVSFTLTGYQIEHREVDIGAGPLEMPAVILRPQGGVLLLSSNPPGAAILVNGKAVTEVTPARLALTPGAYKITVEKNGQTTTVPVEIKNGDTRLLKVTLGQ